MCGARAVHGGELDELGSLLETLRRDDESVTASANTRRNIPDPDALVLRDVDEEEQDEALKLALSLSMQDK